MVGPQHCIAKLFFFFPRTRPWAGEELHSGVGRESASSGLVSPGAPSGRSARRYRPIDDITIRLRPQQPALQHAFGQFLDEQRHTVGAVGDLVDDRIRERLTGDQRCPSTSSSPQPQGACPSDRWQTGSACHVARNRGSWCECGQCQAATPVACAPMPGIVISRRSTRPAPCPAG